MPGDSCLYIMRLFLDELMSLGPCLGSNAAFLLRRVAASTRRPKKACQPQKAFSLPAVFWPKESANVQCFQGLPILHSPDTKYLLALFSKSSNEVTS